MILKTHLFLIAFFPAGNGIKLQVLLDSRACNSLCVAFIQFGSFMPDKSGEVPEQTQNKLAKLVDEDQKYNFNHLYQLYI